MKKISSPILLLLVTVIWFIPGATQTFAQSNSELRLSLRKDFGYALGGDIQGTFTISATGPETITRVVFSLDGETLGEDTEPPFRVQFSTDNYSLGGHQISATGYTKAGEEIRSNVLQANFVSSSEGWQSALRFLIPVLAVVAGAVLLSFIFPVIFKRRTKSLPLGTPRSYGPFGGTICPKCGRPFGMHIYGFNMLTGKLDRCPYCGKWSVVRRATPDALAQAENAEIGQAGVQAPELAISEEERLRREVEESRYQDL